MYDLVQRLKDSTGVKTEVDTSHRTDLCVKVVELSLSDQRPGAVTARTTASRAQSGGPGMQ